ncbi:Protein SQS1 [Madurella mycetomatis]|uniref:Protein SQS1 n=1 Tax=Madurella mycetomatis TaxID=100816 RepID=A0A175VU73_9PEZI|nr:Protein SQS1 [Madurella mycetomatis]KXX74731.1 Protein SQS1 [Madurella mycetomatis]
MPSRRGKRPAAGQNSARARPAAAEKNFGYWFSTNPPTRAVSDGFSMKDEARNTVFHQSKLPWGSKLRERPVTFVRAGVFEPLKDLKLFDSRDATVVEEPQEGAMENHGDNAEVDGVTAEEISVQTTEAINTVTTVKQHNPATRGLSSHSQSDAVSQPTEAQSGDTKDLFFYDLEGDHTMDGPSIAPPKISSPRSSQGASDSSEEVILYKGRSADTRAAAHKPKITHQGAPAQAAVASLSSGKKTPDATPKGPRSQNIKSTSQPHQERSKPHRSRSGRGKAVEDDEDEILADYIANMTANSDDDILTRRFQSLSSRRDLGGDDFAVHFGSADEKCPGNGDSTDNRGTGPESSDIGDSEEDDLVEIDEDEQAMDADMDDETLARLFAKQEELGIRCDELLLTSSSSFTKVGSRARAKRNRPFDELANTISVADAFDGLDIGQPVRKRRSKQPPNFNVSDSEIEAALQSAWRRDRERKKKRKMDRETLRAEGLLGKNVDPDDLRIKYPSAMTLDDFKTEITSFLLGTEERLDFPPLDKHARKVLHELASKFNIKSQSTGKGDQRRPVLYRTNRTIRYASTRVHDVNSHVEEAALRIHRKYFHRVDINGKTASPKTTAGGRGFKSLRLREGEIVGASVPELSQENKGRTMLEKMGWSKGMSLGATDNQGILEPLAQVVKHSKAGLG